MIVQLSKIFIITAFFYLSFLINFLKNSINFLKIQFIVIDVKLICLIKDFIDSELIFIFSNLLTDSEIFINII